jgi:dihydrodiol dehydrogenase / D-xylose 1-dehydrogenase (NADP)
MSLNTKIGWGIIGCGGISGKFAEGLGGISGARLVGCAARDCERAAEFAKTHGFEKSFGSYEELAKDPEINVVYIGTIHPAHFDNTMLCIANGKSVICEKPFAMNVKQTKLMINAAQKAGVFLMEAMWTRFIPGIGKLNEWLDEKVIGEINSVSAEFGFKANFGPESRLFDIALGGGALLDVGIYPVSFASMVFGGKPESFKSYVEMGPTGVDEKAAVIMEYPGKKFANLGFSVNSSMSNEAIVSGTKGYIRVGRPFWHPEKLTLHLDGQEPEVFELPFEDGLNGYSYEAMAVMDDLGNGRTENSLMRLSETLAVMETLDAIREDWGFKYHCELDE